MTITVEQQIPECSVPFTGVLMNGGEYSDDAMDMVLSKRELMSVLPRAIQFQPNAEKVPAFWLGTAFEGSDLQKALEARKGESVSGNASPQASQQAPSKQPEQTPADPVKQAPVHNEPPELDFDSEVPF